MRTIIAGSRDITNMYYLTEAMKTCPFSITTILSGTARGVDTLAIDYGKQQNIPVEKYPANWDLYGKSAGYKRNVLMARHADALIALWDGQSKGTKHMIDIANELNLSIHLVIIK